MHLIQGILICHLCYLKRVFGAFYYEKLQKNKKTRIFFQKKYVHSKNFMVKYYRNFLIQRSALHEENL